MSRIRKFRTALAASATALVATAVLAAPAQADAQPAVEDWDVHVPVTVSTWFGTERVVSGAELERIIAAPGLYRSYTVYLDKYETGMAAQQTGGTVWLALGFDNPPRELVQSWVASVPTAEALASSAVLWGGCVKSTTFLSNPSGPGFVSVHAGKYCS